MRPRLNPTVPRRPEALVQPGMALSPRRRSRLPRPVLRAPGRHGVTLVELIVVVMILAITAAIVVPHAVRSADMQATSAARMLATDLQYAQDYAITTQSPVTVTFDVTGESYSLSNTSGLLNNPITKTTYQVDFSGQSGFEQVELVSADFGGADSVVFDEVGAPDNGGTVVIQAGEYSYAVSVAAATGRVSVSRQ
ncbi:MAG: GspH/FimT family pseudopilin [Phycisphaerae bacterium]